MVLRGSKLLIVSRTAASIAKGEVFMKQRSAFQISLFQSLAAMSMLSLALGLLINVGPLSTLVFAMAAIAIAYCCFRTLNRWKSSGKSPRAMAMVLAVTWIFGVLWISASFWVHPKVYSNRLTTTYRKLLNDSNLDISMSRGEILLLTVSANLRSEDLFNRLRSELRQRFSGELGLHIHWDIQMADGKAILGFDREWFPRESSPR